MSQQIRDAIYAKLTAVQTAGTVYALTEGRIYESAAPQAATLPFLIYRVLEDELELHFGGSRTEKCEIEFEIRGSLGNQTFQQPGGGSPGAQAVGTIEEAVFDLLHGATLTVTGRDRGQVVCQTRGVPDVEFDSHVSRSTYMVWATEF